MIKAVIFDYGGVINRHLRVQRPMLELSRQLRSRGLKTAVLSNMSTPVAWGVKRRPQMNDFDIRVFSCDIGARKPNRQSYAAVLKQLKLKPQECLFIDNRADNIAGAEDLGMPVVWARDTAQTLEDIEHLLKF